MFVAPPHNKVVVELWTLLGLLVSDDMEAKLVAVAALLVSELLMEKLWL